MDKHEDHSNANEKQQHNTPSAENTMRDPVCGMKITPETAKGKSIFHEKTYFFCSLKCKEKFDKNPEKLSSSQPPKKETPAELGVEYTCPMHPEVLQKGPGSCPICGMALEPKGPHAGDADESELKDMTRRFWVCAILTVPLLIVEKA